MNALTLIGGTIALLTALYIYMKRRKGGAGTRVSAPKPAKPPLASYKTEWTPIKPEHADMSVGQIYQMEMQGGVDVLELAQNTDVEKTSGYWRKQPVA